MPLILGSLLALLSSFPPYCSAPAASPEPTLANRPEMAGKFLEDRLNVWQKRLKLYDWKITIVQARASEMRPGTLGNIHWDETDKTAKIRVLRADEYKLPYAAALEDMEFTVVHELIHLELASLPRSDASRSLEEHAVNHMTEALLALDRKQ